MKSPGRGQGRRDLLNNGPGKGDKPRSNFDANWRNRYDEIDWSGSQTGFERLGPHKTVKRYGPAEPVKHGEAAKVVVK